MKRRFLFLLASLSLVSVSASAGTHSSVGENSSDVDCEAASDNTAAQSGVVGASDGSSAGRAKSLSHEAERSRGKGSTQPGAP